MSPSCGVTCGVEKDVDLKCTKQTTSSSLFLLFRVTNGRKKASNDDQFLLLKKGDALLFKNA